MSGVQVSMRASAVSLTLSGLVVAAATPWHPSLFDRPVDQVVRSFDAWAFLHALAVLAVILALVGAIGLVAAHEDRLGRLGQVGLIVTFIGVILTAALAATEAIVFPVLADQAPTLLAIDGPLLRSPLFIGMGILALGWPIGLALLGLSAARSRTFGRPPGLLLAISGPLFLALAGPFVPVAGVLSAILFGGAQMWWGLLLWRSSSVPEVVDVLPRRSSVE